MAYLEQLRIAGIRSYGQTTDETALIRFLRPLTILSGPNGSGKTTIIECLRYMCTGAFPTGQMNAFVQDLEMSRVSRVDASVALQFRDLTGNQVIAIKRLCTTMTKDKKPKCKTEEPTLVKCDEHGNKVSLSAKVIDFRAEILHLLGLPPAILENVIFCHQENSTWPMCDPRVLKTRFDEIFQLTRFTKAIDNMKKIKKELEGEIRLHEERTLKLNERLDNKLMQEWTKAQCEKKIKREQAKVDELKEKIQEIVGQMREVTDKIRRFEDMQRKYEESSIKLQSDKSRLTELLDNVRPFNGTQEELKAELEKVEDSDEFHNVTMRKSQMQLEINEWQAKLERLMGEKRRAEQRRQDANMHLHQKKTLEKEYHELRDKCEDEFGLAGAKETESELKDARETSRKELDAVNAEFEKRKDELSRLVDDAQREQNRMEYTKEGARKKLLAAECAVKEARRKLDRIEQYNQELVALADQISEKKNELLKCPAVDETFAETLRRQRLESQKKVDQLRGKLQNLGVAEGVKKEHEMYVKEAKEKQEELSRLMAKHTEDWRAVFGTDTWTSGPWSEQVKARHSAISEELNICEFAYHEVEIERKSLENKKGSLMEEKQKLQKEVETLNDTITEICNCSFEDLDSKLKKRRKELIEARAKLAPLEGKESLYKSWLEESRDKSCCPLCSRKFPSPKQLENFVQGLENVSMSTPAEAEQLRRHAKLLESEESALSRGEVYIKQLRDCEKKLEEVETETAKVVSSICKLETDIQQASNRKDEIKRLSQAVNNILVDISLMDLLFEQTAKINDKVSRFSVQLQKVESDMRNAEKFRIEIQTELDTIAQCEAETERVTAAMSKRNKITNELHELNVSENRYKEEMMEKKRLEDTIVEQEEVKTECEMELQNAETDYPALTTRLKDYRSDLSQLDESYKSKERELSAKLAAMNHSLQRLSVLREKLNDLQVDDAMVANLAEMCARLDDDIETMQRQKVNAEMKINDLQSGQMKRRILRDQLTIMELSARVEQLERDKQQCTWNEEPRDQLNNMYNALSAEKEKTEAENSRTGGKLEELQIKLQEATRELQRKEYKSVLEELRKSMIAAEVNKNAVTDIETYSTVLDKKLIEFHAEKMQEVNDILDELWRQVYDGADIESVRIRAEKGKVPNKSRSTYDYCVNMVVEGGVEVEMKDKSSAGQKMLASILIRIALADAFGGVCSMIALDEPTTNLDKDKVEQLASMLNKLLAHRSKKNKEFQMIVISHDDYLVDMLIAGSQPEYTYHLHKNANGHTVVKKVYTNTDIATSSGQRRVANGGHTEGSETPEEDDGGDDVVMASDEEVQEDEEE